MPDHNNLINGFDLSALSLPQNFGEALGVKRLITHVPVRKPTKTEFFRVHAGEEWRFQTMTLEMKVERETYIVAPSVWDVVPELLRPATLHAAIDTSNNVFLVAVPLPGHDGRRNLWHQTLLTSLTTAEKIWVRSIANLKCGGYDTLFALGNIAEPEWPDLTLHDLIQIAFRNHVIDTPEHPVIRQLLGAG